MAGRKLRQVPASPGFQSRLLARAAESIYAADRVADRAPSTAFLNAYDGMRHCVDAHLNNRGLRVESGEGGHRHRVDYAGLAMIVIVSQDDLDYYRAARGLRNETEYPDPSNVSGLDEAAARKAIEVARRFHRATYDELRPKRRP